MSDLVIFNVSRTTAPREGDLIALDKITGSVVWRRHLSNYSWSSPTLITASDGAVYGVLADSDGVMHLFDPATGEDISTVSLGKNVEATPAIFGDTLVVASYDRNIYAIKIRWRPPRHPVPTTGTTPPVSRSDASGHLCAAAAGRLPLGQVLLPPTT